MNRKSLYAALVCGVTALTFTGCSKSENSVEKVEELPMVELDVATMQAVPQTKTYTANVEADNLNNISPNSPNRITEIRVDVGDHVQRGQVLVVFDATDINQAKISLDQAKREYARASELLEIGAGTRQTVDQLKDQLDVAQSRYDLLSRNNTLVSPINGVVTARNYDPGDMTGQLPVLTVGQLSPNVKVMINITENDRALVRKGMPVEVTFDAFPGETFKGRINRVYPTIDTNTRTFGVEVLVPNPGERFVQGMFARVELDFGEKDHVVVPDRAVVKQSGSGNKYVYVYKDGAVSFNRVELGRRLGSTYELISGVEPGDSVVVVGQSRLADGVNVEVIRR